ncbi:MAG TPA: ABC transporter permease [Vicinamibacterales bacterium]
MNGLSHDIRFGVRQLVRQPGASLVALLTLALGIGVSTAIFSVIDSTILRPLPYPNPEQLVMVGAEEMGGDGRASRPTPSMEDLRRWQDASDVFSLVAGAGQAFRGRIADGPEPERLRVAHYTEDYLSMHGVSPILGRGFTREDTEPGAPLVALLGYGYWQSRFGGRTGVLGETVRLDEEVATIVGVMPAWFSPTTPMATPLQIPTNMFSRRGTGRLSVYARLQPGVTVEQAAERLSARMPPVESRDGTLREVRAYVTSRLEQAISRASTTVNVLAGAVALILVIAAVNVAGLLLARGAARQAELAVRASLGAGRGRLVRQLLTESLVLAVPAAAFGVLLAWLTLDLIVASLPLSIPGDSPVALNLTVLALTTALLVPTTLLFGLLPAIRLSRVRLGSVMARGSRQVGSSLSHRGGQALIAAEVALAVILVVGAGLMIRSFMRITAIDLGFEPHGLMTMEVLPLDRDPAAHRTYYWNLQERLQTMPGIASAGIVDNFPLMGGGSYSSVTAAGRSVGTTIFNITPGYLETIGARLIQGRLPTASDYTSGFRAVVLNRAGARALFPDGSAVGREISGPGSDKLSWTVIGVIDDLRHGGPLADTERMRGLQVYFPLEPDVRDLTQAMNIVVRPTGGTAGLADRLRQAAREVGPRVLVERIRTGEELFGGTVRTPQQRMTLLALLGGLGLTLALVGVYGMTSYAVARRTGEIGVRMAFGARPSQVVGTMLRGAALPILVGTALGVGGAMLATRVIESFLFDTAPRDPVTLATVAATLVLAGCLAALVPALRAARVDPALTLRAD